MQVRIKRIDDSLPLPKYETSGAVAFDIMAKGDHKIEPGKIALIPTNLIIEVPEGYMLMLASRSSTPKKKGLNPPHGVGIIDQDYCGPSDELKVQVYNFSDGDVEVFHGEKIAQGVFVRVDKMEIIESEEFVRERSRGGFGATGGYKKVEADVEV